MDHVAGCERAGVAPADVGLSLLRVGARLGGEVCGGCSLGGSGGAVVADGFGSVSQGVLQEYFKACGILAAYGLGFGDLEGSLRGVDRMGAEGVRRACERVTGTGAGPLESSESSGGSGGEVDVSEFNGISREGSGTHNLNGKRDGDCGSVASARSSGSSSGGGSRLDVCATGVVGGRSSVLETRETGDGSSVNRGPNWARNQVWKQEKKGKKSRRRQRAQDSVNWRATAAPKPVERECVEVGRSGFMSSCADEVRKELYETRARRLIAENKRRAMEDERKVKQMESPEAIMRDVLAVVRSAERLKKQTADAAIGGWAETVADGLVRSVAENAPSTVPSLESVGYGKSALRSSSGATDETKESLRQAEYKLALMQLDREADGMLYYDNAEYVKAKNKIMEEFSDVAYTSQEYLLKVMKQKMVGTGVLLGKGLHEINQIYAEMGLPLDEEIY